MTVAEAERPLPLLRLLPAPDSEPPYDDELPGGRPLPLRATSVRPAGPLRLVPRPAAHVAPRPASDLPSVQPFAHALVQRLLEVLAGVRPLAQLQRDTTLEVYERLERLVCARPRSAGPRPDRRSIRSVHVQEQADGVAEVFATVRRGARYGTVAFRARHTGDRWCCVELTCP